MTDSDGDSEDVAQIKDPEAYVNQRRLQQLFDLRENLHKSRLKLAEIEHNRRHKRTRWEALNAYRALVDSYILELEPLLLRYEPGPELLNETHFGTVEVTPHYKLEPAGRSSSDTYQVYEPSASTNNSSDDYVRVQNRPHEVVEYELEGLRSVLELPSPLTATYTFNKFKYAGKGKSFKHTAKTQIRMETMDTMVRKANNFLAEIGFTVSPEPEDDPAMI